MKTQFLLLGLGISLSLFLGFSIKTNPQPHDEYKAEILLYAMTPLNNEYSFHDLKAAIYRTNSRYEVNDIDIQVGDVVLLKRSEAGPIGGAPQSMYPDTKGLDRNFAKPFFGKDVPVKIKLKNGQTEIDTSLYIPNSLQVTAKLQDPRQIQVGDSILWEADPYCPQVHISVVYFPALKPGVSEVDGERFRKDIENTGLYVVSKEDMKELDKKGPGSFYFSIKQEANYQLLGKSSREIYKLSSFTEVSMHVRK